MLEALGLSTRDAETYALLVEMPGCSMGDLVDASRWPAAEVRESIQRLVEATLANRLPGELPSFIAVHPEAAFTPIIRRREAELRQAQDVISRLAETARRNERFSNPAELIEVIVGTDAIIRRQIELQELAQVRMDSIDCPPYVSTPGANPVEFDLLAAGLQYRTIYAAEGVQIAGRLELDIRGSVTRGEHARVHPKPPLKLFIADNKLALIPIRVTPTGVNAAFIVHPCGLLDALVALFEREWERAVPIRAFTPHQSESTTATCPNDESKVLLSALAAGLTDEGIARAMGCSLRTAQRRIQKMMAMLSVTSRFQAGMAARERGWV